MLRMYVSPVWTNRASHLLLFLSPFMDSDHDATRLNDEEKSFGGKVTEDMRNSPYRNLTTTGDSTRDNARNDSAGH